jgi:hypothetical protein
MDLAWLQLEPDYQLCLEEWANNLGVTTEELVRRFVIASLEGSLYSEGQPDWRPETD